MKRVLTDLMIMFLFVSCVPANQLAPAATAIPSVAPVVVEATPTLQTFLLFGPQDGSRMTWLDGSTLINIAGGEFVMGNGAADAPAHRVRLSSYWIQQTEVTNAMYHACVRAGVCRGLVDVGDSMLASRPVVGVKWEHAQVYCSWIQGRLPTEAEWERAAQGPDGSAYPWGNEAPDCTRANFSGCSRPLSPAGSYSSGASPLGVLDMSGNAAEWIGDWYDPNYYSTSIFDDPIGPLFSDVRVVRGGSFTSTAGQLGAAVRSYNWTRNSRADLGFRCVVKSPILFPPFCQVEARVPANPDVAAVTNCQPPETNIKGQFCQKKMGYVSLDIPTGARWLLETSGFYCTVSSVSDTYGRLTCYGQGNQDIRVTVCSAACFGNTSGGEPLCPPGYDRDLASGKCNYTLALEGTCPEGFSNLEMDGSSVCLPTPANQECPVGQYFDTSIGACLPGSGQIGCLYYGLQAEEGTAACYQGCQPGYAYDAALQCCQSKTGVFPGCGPGYIYDDSTKACIPGGGVGGQGCETVSLRTGACVDCGVYPNCNPGCKIVLKTKTCIMP